MRGGGCIDQSCRGRRGQFVSDARVRRKLARRRILGNRVHCGRLGRIALDLGDLRLAIANARDDALDLGALDIDARLNARKHIGDAVVEVLETVKQLVQRLSWRQFLRHDWSVRRWWRRRRQTRASEAIGCM